MENMNLNFCVFTASNYLAKAIALYYSLCEHCKSFTLYYICYDSQIFEYLKKANYPNIIPVPFQDVEDEKLLEIKGSRTNQEYFFTLTPSIILYLIKTYQLELCTYLDADLFFYDNPQKLLDELQDNDVIITEHRYTPRFDQTHLSGQYCVQFMPFKNTCSSIEILEWWRNACIEWCFLKAENGKWADQGYLKDWTTRFNKVHVLQNLGGGVAPWNVQQYKIYDSNKLLFGRDKKNQELFSVNFYHFQAVKFHTDNTVSVGNYIYDKQVIKLFYKPYIKILVDINNEIKKNNIYIDPLGITAKKQSFRLIFNDLVDFILNKYNTKSVEKWIT